MSGETGRAVRQIRFFGFLVAALVIMQASKFSIPLIGWLDIPLGYFRTWFHEMSHGLAAIATGGSAGPFVLNLLGGGHIMTGGGWEPLVVFAGYGGAIFFGAIIFIAGNDNNHRRSSLICNVLAGIVGFTAVFWVRDLVTAVIVVGILLSFGVLGRWDNALTHNLFRFIGMFVVLSGIYAPTWQWFHILRGSNSSDAARLAEVTLIPSLFWIGLWVAGGLFALLVMYRHEKNSGR